MDSEGKPDFNIYKLWSNHRRVITFGGLLILFGAWINPIIQTHKRKSICADVAGYIGFRPQKESETEFYLRMSKKLGIDTEEEGFSTMQTENFCTFYKSS